MTKVKALYGFSRDLRALQDLSPQESAQLLADWGANVVFGGYDDVAFVDAAHAAGLRVMAEFGCFVREKWWERYPESRPITAQGELLPVVDWYAGVNPSVQAVRQELLDDLANLVQSGQVDGVWLDFIRWPSRWESPQPKTFQTSFDVATLAKFQKATGITVPNPQEPTRAADWLLTHQPEAWTRWKCQQITDWVKQAAEIVHNVGPRPCLLGMFTVPWRQDDFDGGITRIMGQDLAALGQHVDILSPMVYHRMCGQDLDWISSVTREAHELSARPIWPIVQTMSRPDRLSNVELAQAMATALNAPGSAGVILFNLKGALDEGRESTIQEGFRNIDQAQQISRGSESES